MSPTFLSIIRGAQALATWVAPTLYLSLAIYTIYMFVFDPLRGVPGPWLAKHTNAWLAAQVRNGRMLQISRELHEEYGPVVRVGPTEVWFDSPEAFRLIYSSTRGFEKSDFYLATALQRPKIQWGWPLKLIFPDTLDLLSERDMERYRLQRRLIGPVYQPTNLKKFGNAIDETLHRLVAKLKAMGGAEVDLKEWMHIAAVECLGAVVLSWAPGFINDESDWGTSSHSYLGWRRKSVFGLFPPAVIVESLYVQAGRWFATLWGLNYTPPEKFKPFFPVRNSYSSQTLARA